MVPACDEGSFGASCCSAHRPLAQAPERAPVLTTGLTTPCAVSKPAVDVAAMADRDHEDDEQVVCKFVQDSVVSGPDAINVGEAHQLLAPDWTRLLSERIETPADSRLILSRELSEFAFC